MSVATVESPWCERTRSLLCPWLRILCSGIYATTSRPTTIRRHGNASSITTHRPWLSAGPLWWFNPTATGLHLYRLTARSSSLSQNSTCVAGPDRIAPLPGRCAKAIFWQSLTAFRTGSTFAYPMGVTVG